ncbi:MAG TPA: metal-dependent hydrolase [Miltoncostaeaceae bacterium]|nr:metal-dependent hydrolase [Miltoncostaeaceae bacterium]
MSWAAHDLEPYLFRAKLGGVVSLPLCLFGSYSPDIATKWAVYGLGWSGHEKLVDDPVALHRGFPGVGFTHSLAFGLLVGAVILALSRNWIWAFSFVLGAWAHVFSDTLDSVGVMLFFPFTEWHLHFDVWQYVGQAGRKEDAIAYYTSLGGVWDILWAVWLSFNWRMFTAHHFHTEIVPRDTFWLWLRTKASDSVMLTVYRASAFFGVASIIGWYIWALLINDFHAALDWSLGGPQWAPRIGPP